MGKLEDKLGKNNVKIHSGQFVTVVDDGNCLSQVFIKEYCKEFCSQVEGCAVGMVELGLMSRDLAGAKQRLVNVKEGDYLITEAFVKKVAVRLEKTRDKHTTAVSAQEAG